MSQQQRQVGWFVKVVVAAMVTAAMTAFSWAYSQINANTAKLVGHEQRLDASEKTIGEIHKDVREIREWTRRR